MPPALTSVAEAFAGMRVGRFLFRKGRATQGTALISAVFPNEILVSI
jgi:hypothetical protein